MTQNWYEQRDKRTDGCAGVTGEYKVASVLARITDNLEEPRVQLMAFFSLTMLARWCRKIVIQANDAKSEIEGGAPSFIAQALERMREIDPEGDFSVCSVAPETTAILFIGMPEESNTDFVCINCNGWISSCAFNRSADITGPMLKNHIIGASFAASLGNAEIFRLLNNLKSDPYSKWYSLWKNEVFNQMPLDANGKDWESINLGRTHIIGCGAIGSSFVTILPYCGLTGRFLTIDPDNIEPQNTSSSMLFTSKDIGSKRKAELCSKYLVEHHIDSNPYTDTYSAFNYEFNADTMSTADLILCFANDHDIWTTVQHRYPPLCFHATTSKSWGLNVGRHIPLKENCIVCTFERFLTAAFKPVCAAVEITHQTDMEDKSHTAILPFLAPAAAIVTASELIKCFLDHPNENTTMFDMETSNGIFLGEQGAFGRCFVCKDQRELYGEFGPYSMHWHLSTLSNH